MTDQASNGLAAAVVPGKRGQKWQNKRRCHRLNTADCLAAVVVIECAKQRRIMLAEQAQVSRFQHSRRQLQALTQHTLRSCPPSQQCGQPQITNLDNALTTIDEDVVAFEISVDDWRRMTMQVHQPTQDLPGPAFQDLWVNVLVAFAISASTSTSEKPCTELV